MKSHDSQKKIWNSFIEEHEALLKERLTELEISALAACIGDCHQSFNEIFLVKMEMLKKSRGDNEKLLEDILNRSHALRVNALSDAPASVIHFKSVW